MSTYGTLLTRYDNIINLQILMIIKWGGLLRMKFLTRNTRGFTLLEILIVLVILAVLAGLAIPSYQAAVEKSRAQEALTSLTATKESLMRYFAVFGTYVGATFAPGPNSLDYNPNLAIGGQTLIFTYVLGALTATTFTVTATRTGGPVGTVALSQNGVITRTGVYL